MTRAEQLADLDAQTSRLVDDTDGLARQLRWVIAQDAIHAARQAEIHARRYGG